MSKKKVAILYSGGRYYGGIERYLFNLLTNAKDPEIELELLSLGEWKLTKKLRAKGINPTILNKRRISPRTIELIGHYLNANRFDLLVSQGTVANAYARAVSFAYKIPNLVTIHSVGKHDYKLPILRGIYGFIELVTRFRTSHYITVSQYLADRLAKTGVSRKKISVIYNGLDFPSPSSRPHKRLVIGSLGRLHQVKGYDILIEALSLIKNKRIRLKIAGSGTELEALKQLATELNVASRVEFVGYQEDNYKFLDSIDVYVQSSRSEGFGLAVIEAMSQELPVVVTPAGSLREIVHDGGTGYISSDIKPAELAEAIERALSNVAESSKIGQNARQFVLERFSLTAWVEATLEVYKKIAR